MTTRAQARTSFAALSVGLLLFAGCSSSASAPGGDAGGGGGAAGGGAGAGGGGEPGTGGVEATGGLGGSIEMGSGGAGGAQMCPADPAPDPSCTTAAAKMGAVCTKDCCIQCGFNGMGTKTCTCANGAYSMCPCMKPSTYLGAPTAPTCDTPDGTTLTLKNTLCTTEWQECVGKDVVSGSTPQGCVCMSTPVTNVLQWYCGSTNKWFVLSTSGP